MVHVPRRTIIIQMIYDDFPCIHRMMLYVCVYGVGGVGEGGGGVTWGWYRRPLRTKLLTGLYWNAGDYLRSKSIWLRNLQT